MLQKKGDEIINHLLQKHSNQSDAEDNHGYSGKQIKSNKTWHVVGKKKKKNTQHKVQANVT